METIADRFLRRRKYRYVVPFPDGGTDWDGTTVSRYSWCHGLRGCDWFETRPSSIEQCIIDDVIPCVDGGEGMLTECASRQWPISFLPNTVFFDSGSRWKNAGYF